MNINDETQSLPGSGEIPQPTADQPGDLPGYVLSQEVGRGGMGVVYRARDLGMNREVAVKILLDRFAPDSTTAERFVAEAQITGQLQHPGIPAVYHVGQMSDHRPFLAMRLIKGETLSTLLKRERPQNALAVFEAIAQAVGYAHAHEVIHRDLKPANVMVGPFGEVQVMDWGLAKVLARGSASRGGGASADPEATTAPTEIRTLRDSDSSFTQAGSVLGTPAYMAPEQAAGEVEKVDRRSDVFGLGAILCVLLTGEPPFQGRDAESIRLAAVRGKTEEAFARLDACGAEPDVVALCKRCLSFEPADRPADASGVALEVANLRAAAEDRARQAELARARAEVQAEEQRKRRRVVQAAAVGVAAVLLLGIAGTTLGLIRADWARRDAQDAARRADAARGAEAEQRRLAETAKVQSETNLAETQAVLDFVEKRVFAAARPRGQDGGLGPEVTLKRAIESSVPFVADGFREQPLIEARLRWTLGTSFSYLGEPETARAMYQRARELYVIRLGPDHPYTLTSMNGLAVSYLDLGRHAEALPLLQETLERRKARLGPDDPETLASMHNLANCYDGLGRDDAALALREETLKLQKGKLGTDHPHTLAGMSNLATSFSTLGRHAEAMGLREEVLKLQKGKFGTDHPDTLISKSILAVSYLDLGRHAEALALLQEALELQKGKLGADHPHTLASMSVLARCNSALGRHAEALALLEETLKLQRGKFGPDHPETLASMNNLAGGYSALGRHAEALALREEVLKPHKARLGADHLVTIGTMGNLANSYSALGRHAEAMGLREEVLKLLKGKVGPDHAATLFSMSNLAVSYTALGRHAEALALLEEGLKRQKRKLGTDHPDTLLSMGNLAGSLARANRGGEAIPIIDDCVRLSVGKALNPGVIPLVMDVRLRHFQAAGNAAGCRETAAMWERLARGDPGSLYTAARLRAVTAAVLKQAEGADAARPAVEEADRAMVWLTKAVAAGYKNVDHMRKDGDLDALQDRDDFRKLIESLPGKTAVRPPEAE